MFTHKTFAKYTLLLTLTLFSAPSLVLSPEDAHAEDLNKDEYQLLLDGPSIGPKTAPITIIAFSDYQCPFCKRADDTLNELRDIYGDDIRIVFKNYPLPFHKEADEAAQAAYAAWQQGGFETMHYTLFKKQKEFKTHASTIDQYMRDRADFMGLDLKEFKKAYASKTAADAIKEDMKLGSKLGVRGTPHFFINGVRMSGAQPLTKFQEVIDGELPTAKKLFKSTSYTNLHKLRFEANYKESKPPVAEKEDTKTAQMVPVSKADPMRGAKKNALVTVVVFSDFQCPFCQRAANTMEELYKTYENKPVRFVFKHLPLTFHKQADDAAMAAYAAQKQNKFWQMHDLLFEDQKNLKQAETNPEYFISLANKLKLNIKKFESDRTSDAAKQKIKDDSELAKEVGARGTPNFFINGIQVTGAQPAHNFEKVINAQLEVAKDLKKSNKSLKGEAFYKAIVEHNIKAEENKADTAPVEDKKEASTILSKDDFKKLKDAKGITTLGNPKKAKVVIYEFTDLQCPFCARAFNTTKEVHKLYGTDVAIVTFNFPLVFHKQAEFAHKAFIAADKQGKGADMKEFIFTHAKEMKSAQDIDALMLSYAKEAGLDLKKFKKVYNDPSTLKKVHKDIKLGQDLGVRGTPTFFVEDTRLIGAQPVEKFEEAINAKLKK